MNKVTISEMGLSEDDLGAGGGLLRGSGGNSSTVSPCEIMMVSN